MTHAPDPSLSQIYDSIYDELKSIAQTFVSRRLTGRHERTSLVNSSYLKLRTKGHPEVESEEHLKRLMAKAMRFVCRDWYRSDNALKRGGGKQILSLNETNFGEFGESRAMVSDYLVLYDALQEFEVVHPDLAPLIEGWLLWDCSARELADLYAVPGSKAKAGLLMFHQFLQRQS